MLCTTALWEVVGSDLLRSVSCTNLVLAKGCFFRMLLLYFNFKKFGTQQSEGFFFVLQL